MRACTIGITGVTGFVGSYLASYYLARGARVLGLSSGRRSVDPDVMTHPQFRAITHDCAYPLTLPEPVDVLVHAAAQSQPSGFSAHHYIRNNILATENIVVAARQAHISKLIYLSSMDVYGDIQEDHVTEETPVINPSLYGLSKLVGEKIICEQIIDPACVILRLPGVLGPKKSGAWIARLCERFGRNEDVSISNPKALFNNTVWLEDVAAFIKELASQSWQGVRVFNLGCADGLSIEAIGNDLKERTRSSSVMSIAQTSAKNPYTISIEKAKQWGYRPSSLGTILDHVIQNHHNDRCLYEKPCTVE